MSNFIHLHNHSDFSLLTSSLKIEDMVKKAKEMGCSSIALTDNNNLFGAVTFYKTCKKYGINPIIGCDLAITKDIKTKNPTESKSYSRIVLLAKNTTGYKNLIKLVSTAYIEGFYYRPRIDKELLQKYHEGLILLSGSPLEGELGKLISQNKTEEAREALVFYKELFGSDFYIELNKHNITEEDISCEKLIKLAKEFGVKVVAANNVFYLAKEDSKAHGILMNIGLKRVNTKKSQGFFATNEFYLKTTEEMQSLFEDIPEAIASTLEITKKCSDFKMNFIDPVLPDFEIPQGFLNQEKYLEFLVNDGLEKRYKTINKEIEDRAKYELEIIFKTGYVGYFLIVWDFINYAKNSNIPVGPGRGSGAGSIVAYALRITDVDPLKYGLFFERFLNPERVSMPDFDIDFCYEGREQVIKYVEKKYSSERVCQIITFGTLKAKAVVRDVARVLGFEAKEGDAVAKTIQNDDLKIDLETNEDLKQFLTLGEKYDELLQISLKLQNLKRHSSLHAAGIVISKDPLTEYIPLAKDAKYGTITTQFTMDQLEECGLVKMDFLGLKTLTIIKKAVEFIKKTNPNFDDENIPYDDKKTFEMLSSGRNSMVFQFESSGMQKIFKRAKPSSISDLSALNALYRPGPMENIDQYIESKLDKTKIKYPHPDLEGVLKETYGVIVYQEQVMQIAQIIAGFSFGKADILRKAMGKKKLDEMQKMKVEFINGAIAKGYKEELANEIYELLIPFAGYGFNKSHALAYSVLAYKTAYLKANFKEEFLCANLSMVASDPDKRAEYLRDCKKEKVELVSFDINLSESEFSVKDKKIIYGFSGAKGIGEKAIEEIIHQRSRGEFKSFLDFIERANLRVLNKAVLENLIKCGGFDSIEKNRKYLVENLEIFISLGKEKYRSSMMGLVDLFDDIDSGAYSTHKFKEVADYTLLEKYAMEKEILGIAIISNPAKLILKLKSKHRKYKECINIDEITEDFDKKFDKKIVGFCIDRNEFNDNKNEIMCKGILDDYTGQIEFIIFSKVFAKEKANTNNKYFFYINGYVQIKSDAKTFIVQEIKSIDKEVLGGEQPSAKKESEEFLAKDPDLEEHEVKTKLGEIKNVLKKSQSSLKLAEVKNSKANERKDEELHIYLNSKYEEYDKIKERIFAIEKFLKENKNIEGSEVTVYFKNIDKINEKNTYPEKILLKKDTLDKLKIMEKKLNFEYEIF